MSFAAAASEALAAPARLSLLEGLLDLLALLALLALLDLLDLLEGRLVASALATGASELEVSEPDSSCMCMSM